MIKRIEEFLNKDVDDVDKVKLSAGIFILSATITVIIVTFIDTVNPVMEMF